MTTSEIIGLDLKTVLRRLKLGRMLDTLPERVLLARQQKMPHQDFRSSSSATRPHAGIVSPSRCVCSAHGWIPPCIWMRGIPRRRSPSIARC